jgi:hypothetical protein
MNLVLKALRGSPMLRLYARRTKLGFFACFICAVQHQVSHNGPDRHGEREVTRVRTAGEPKTGLSAEDIVGGVRRIF